MLIPLADAPGAPFLPELALPALALAIGLLVVSSLIMSRIWARERAWDIVVIDTALLTLAQMVLIGLLLGTLGLLTVHGLLAVTGLWTIVTVWCWYPADGIGIQLPKREPDERLVDWLPRAIPLAFVLFALLQAVGGRIYRPPIGDAIGYHLPAAVHWMQTHNLSMPIPAAGDPSPPFYPLNSTIWTFWTLAPFDDAALARFVQAPFLILLALAAYRLARELGLSATVGAVAGGLAATLPGVARSASLAENDLITAALLVSATALVAIYWHRPSSWRAVMAALALGLAAGTKVIALALGGPIGLLLLILIVRNTRDWRARSRQIGLVVGVVLLLGGYSYLRNLIVMGNPLYPSAYEIAGQRILDGLYVVTQEWKESHPFYPFDWRGFFLNMRSDFGIAVTWWVLPGMALAGLAVVWRLVQRRWPVLPLTLLVWTPLSLAIFWYIIPYHFSRFLYATVTWGIVVAIWGLGQLLRPLPSRVRDLAIVLLALPVFVVSAVETPLDPAQRERALYWLALVAMLIVATGIVVLLARVDRQRLSVGLGVTALAVLLLASIAWPSYERRYNARQYDEWRALLGGVNELAEAWSWVNQLTHDEPATIAVAGTNEVYPLYGTDLDNRLVTIWPSGELARYGWGEPFQLYSEPDEEAWLRQIERQGVDFIYMTENVSFGGWPIERGWITTHPLRFRLIYQNTDVKIWSVEHWGEEGG